MHQIPLLVYSFEAETTVELSIGDQNRIFH